MIVYQCQNQGCAYSIDSEGTLFYTPMYKDGTVNLEDWCEVDLDCLMGDEEDFCLEVDAIHEQLISISKLMGEYFQK